MWLRMKNASYKGAKPPYARHFGAKENACHIAKQAGAHQFLP